MRKYWFFLPLVIIIIALLVIGCGKTATTTTSSKPPTTTTSTPPTSTALTPKSGGTLKYAESLWYGATLGWPGDPGWLVTSPPCNLFFDTVLNADTKDNITPDLCSATVANDLTSITLTCQKGIKFHDNSDFNATSLKWNLDLLIAGKYGDYSFVKSADIVDPMTVKLTLSSYSNSLLTTLASTMIASQQAYIDHGSNKDAETWMRANAVGTGPFKQTAATPNVSITGVRNDNYFKGKPYLDQIIMTNIPDQVTRVQALQAGEIDIEGGNPGKPEADFLAANKNFKIQADYISISALVPDSKNTASPWANLKVRQALDYAIDRDALVSSLGFGYWTATSQFAVPGTASYNNALPPIKQDLTKAKQLLTDAGYANGFNTQILGSTVTTFKDQEVAIQGMLAKIGITVNVNLIDHPAYNTAIQKGWDGLAAAGKLIDANLGWALGTNFGQQVIGNASLDKTNDFQALLNAALASKDYDPALVQKCLAYMYNNSMVNCQNATKRGQTMANYVMGADFYTYDRAMYWSPAKVWLNK
ncbi:MAG TPA: ABC transporter substrate-binding protein [Dehalococcoidales bacterium]|nr:ABC transporter substrate-binding protein [Dehalococcoidales bacterium]